jgi:methylmalonyl-CoA mutase N-terminal domain/subunit
MSERYTQSGIPLKPLYTPEDTQDIEYEAALGDPGSFPYTRGRRLQPAGAVWIQRELSGEGDPRRSNEQFKYLLSKGQMGVDVIGDTPTMAMLDPDHPLARNAVGTQGVSLCCKQDFVDLLAGLPLDTITVSGSLQPAFGIAGFYMAARQLGVDPAILRGSVVQAPFYCEDCGYATHMPFKLRLRLTSDSIAFSTREMPKFHAFLEDTYYISDGGLNAVEEMALGFVEIRYVVRDLLRRGLDIDSFAPRIAILVNCHMDFFETIAKIRATRRLYSRMMRDEFGARDPRSLTVNIASHTSGLSLTAQQPVNNVVRGTIQALSLVLAGVQAMEISTFDEAYRTPSPEAHEVGLRTQQIIQLESNVTQVNDPLGGSYYIESLTNELERRIWDMVTEIEALGDPATLSDQGWFRDLFVSAMDRHIKGIEEGTIKKVGLNVFHVPEEEDTLLKSVAEKKIEPCHERIEAVRNLRRERNQGQVNQALQELFEKTKHEGENVMYPIIAASEAGATMGELGGVLRRAYGAPYDPFQMIDSPLAL